MCVISSNGTDTYTESVSKIFGPLLSSAWERFALSIWLSSLSPSISPAEEFTLALLSAQINAGRFRDGLQQMQRTCINSHTVVLCKLAGAEV